MPAYDYRCKACGHEFELVQKMTAPTRRKCPACSKLQLERLIGIGAGFIIKGGAASAKAEAAEKAKDEKDRKASAESSQKKSEGKEDTSKASGPQNSEPPQKEPEKKVEPPKATDTEKKISGSTSTPTHKAREGRGVGNLVDKAKRRSKEAKPKRSKKKKQ